MGGGWPLVVSWSNHGRRGGVCRCVVRQAHHERRGRAGDVATWGGVGATMLSAMRTAVQGADAGRPHRPRLLRRSAELLATTGWARVARRGRAASLSLALSQGERECWVGGGWPLVVSWSNHVRRWGTGCGGGEAVGAGFKPAPTNSRQGWCTTMHGRRGVGPVPSPSGRGLG